jgi:diguanylate cyclase (GGDEF)-like protein
MNEQLARKIARCPNLPSLPAIAVQVLELTRLPDVDISELAKVISKDSALSSKILRTVNSSYYGRSKHVGTISQALVILGLQAVKTLVLGFSLVTNLSGQKTTGFNHLEYWKRSIYAANAARTLANRLGIVQQEEAFLAAVLQDIGMLVLDRVMPAEYGKIHLAVKTHAALPAAEREILGADHAEVGGMMAETWKLPEVLQTPIERHHAPERAKDPMLQKLSEVVGLAGTCGGIFVEPNPAPLISRVRSYLHENHQISEADADAMLKEIGASTKEVATLFEINIGVQQNFEDILKRANEALVEITLESQQQATSLRELNQQLKREATTDALTGLANRGQFDKFLSAEFDKATQNGTPLTLVMMDVDKFKSINDKYGHLAGDKVLKRLAAILIASVRKCDLAARYGGEEMAIILPGVERQMAAAIAENFRRLIESRPIGFENTPIAVTASFGVAMLEPGSPFKVPSHLIKAADMAVYAAKHGGRNCVKVFALKSAPAVAPRKAG